MTYALAQPLQAALYQRLSTDPVLLALTEGHVYDQLPPGPVPSLYLTLGPEVARDRSDKTGQGSEHDLTLTIVATATGFSAAKTAAAAASDAVLGEPLMLARGRVVGLSFLRAQARPRGQGETRQIDLTFRARVEDDPDA